MRRWFRRSRSEEPRVEQDWVARQLEARGIRDAAVLAAMRAVPREKFVPPDLERQAYDDGALPIGHGQTISQPYIVARMTQALALGDWSAAHSGARPRVLDVGTGSGYQAAVLAELVRWVYSIEVIPDLAEEARTRLRRLGYRNVSVKTGDGNAGWPEHAPFDGIIVTAAAAAVPEALPAQLRNGGRLVIPVGQRDGQDLMLIEKSGDGEISQRSLLRVAFVPLVGG
jgi:protein-L-isoaspartate(D-aspartate) O-methyltransferase